MKLLVVESPAKAKTIKGYLDSNFDVIATIGHFRDLPEKGIGIDEKNNFFVKEWKLDKKIVDLLLKSIKKSSEIFLALDPDREGEMIAWHLLEICKEKKLLNGRVFKRIEFTAIRKEDILQAINKPRNINENLVNSAITRRFLDRFFGYKISPITKRRTIFGVSAGRVQSPTLKIISEKEREIDLFKPEEYWEILIDLVDKSGNQINCKPLMDGEKKIEKFYLKNKTEAQTVKKRIQEETFSVSKIFKREKKRNPYSPFSNSLLLQDASSKLGFSPKHTNHVAQQLKDGVNSLGGLITYHRTDSNQMKKSEIKKLRDLISIDVGKEFLSKNENIYREKAKFVQQGHEAVTPTQLDRKPEKIKNSLSEDQFKLYDLIWKRTYASQMTPSVSLETTVYFKSNNFLLKASGSIPKFQGFKKIYNYLDKKEDSQNLPDLRENDKLSIQNLEVKQNFTKPPNRYSEAGVIKKLEELGIGRPSTYHNILSGLEKKNYIEVKNKSLIPTSKGKILSKFLDGFFSDFVDYEFTASLEEKLDMITQSKLDWKETLNEFLKILNTTVKNVERKSISEVINNINELSPEILKEKSCPKCKNGDLTIKFSSSGPFVGCTKYSKDNLGCSFSQPIGIDENNQELSGQGKLIGNDLKTGKTILLKIGKYGRYLEIKDDDDKPKRIGIPKKMQNSEINIDRASKLLSLPRKIGEHPESKKDIIASIGPYGPYIKHNNKFVSLKDDDVTEIGINRAVELIEQKLKLQKEIQIGIHPETKKEILQKSGIKGRPDYISYNKKNYSIPDDLSKSKILLEQALKIINEKKSKKKV